jgi:pyrroloquinoline quinone (PQQ) biosynthesis protein C
LRRESMNEGFLDELRNIVRERDLEEHPLVARIEHGEASREGLKRLAVQWCRWAVRSTGFRGYLYAKVVEGAWQDPQEALRRMIVQGILEEETHSTYGPPHRELPPLLARALGATEEEIQGTPPIPEIVRVQNWIYRVARREHPAVALAAGGVGMEEPFSRVAGRLAKALRHIYGLSEEAVGFFSVHAVADVEHGEIAYRAVRDYARTESEQERVRKHVRQARDLFWKMHDGFHRLVFGG